MTGSEPHRSQGSVASKDQTRTRAALRNSNRNLSELCFENGDWIMREPGNSEQVRETLGHTQELRGVTTVPLVRSLRINLPLLSQTCSSFSCRRRDQELVTGWTHRAQAQSRGLGSPPLPRPVSQHHHHHYHHYRHRQVIIRTTSPPLLRETSCLCLTLTGDFTQYSKSQMLTF